MRELATLDRERLTRVGFTAVAPFAVLQALSPERFPPDMFYEGLLEDTWAHRDDYRWLTGSVRGRG
jgi:hypothetical protein